MPSSSGPPLPREAIVSKPLAKGLSVQLRCIKHTITRNRTCFRLILAIR
jgi:hypothetical protein